MNHRTSPASIERTTRSTPSAPMPARRSQSALTRAGVSSSGPSPGGSSTKSLPVPCPLTNCTLSSVGREGSGQRVQRALATWRREPGGALPAGAVRKHQARLLGAVRAAEQVAERAVAAELAQPRAFRPRLDAFGDNPHAVGVRELDDRRHDAVVLEVRPDTAHERLVELHRLDRQLAKGAERGVPRAEVVDGQRDARVT